MPRERLPIWGRSITAEDRVQDRLDPNGRYQGRQLIARDSPIDGRVSIGGWYREAIVVEFEESDILKSIYEMISKRASGALRFLDKEAILRNTYEFVRKAFDKGGEEEVTRFVDSLNAGDDVKVRLDVFLQNRVGVCRHYALTAGVLLEKFIRDGHLKGKLNVDRNEIQGRGAHEWARYTTWKGTPHIMDCSLEFFGTLAASRKVVDP